MESRPKPRRFAILEVLNLERAKQLRARPACFGGLRPVWTIMRHGSGELASLEELNI